MAGSRATATAADKKPFSRLAQTSPSIGAKRSLAISNFAATEARSLQSTHFDNNDVKCPTQIMGHSDRRIWKPVKVCTNCCCRPSGPSTTLQHLRFNHVEIVAIVALLDDRLLGRYLALEHGVQHLVHLRVTKANPNVTSIWPRAVADTKKKTGAHLVRFQGTEQQNIFHSLHEPGALLVALREDGVGALDVVRIVFRVVRLGEHRLAAIGEMMDDRLCRDTSNRTRDVSNQLLQMHNAMYIKLSERTETTIAALEHRSASQSHIKSRLAHVDF